VPPEPNPVHFEAAARNKENSSSGSYSLTAAPACGSLSLLISVEQGRKYLKAIYMLKQKRSAYEQGATRCHLKDYVTRRTFEAAEA
jgi:hypothetical protein